MRCVRLRLGFTAEMLLGVVIIAGCGSAADSAAPPPQSGIEGRTMVDGGCPVLRPDTPCPEIPHPARIVVASTETAATVVTADSDSSGRFRIPLEPGTYTLKSTNIDNAFLPRAMDLRVTVTAGHYEDLTITFDSGIRGIG
jgi:hypothetical protein